MKVLVTGSAGQLGRALLANVPAGIDAVGVSRSELDITDRDAVLARVREMKPDFVINAAAYTAVDKAEEEEALANAINADGTAWLAEAASEVAARLLHVSTDFVFDGSSSRPYQPGDEPAPLGAYGRSKRRGEELLIERLGDDALVLRTAWVYDAEGRNFLNTMLRLMRDRDELRVVQDQVGTPTSTASLSRVAWALVQADARGIFHWTDAGVASWYDFAVAIFEEARALGLLDHDVTIEAIPSEEFPTPAKRPAFSVLDRYATEKAAGFRARHWRVELRRVLDTMKDSAGGLE